MRKLIIATHGKLAAGFRHTLGMLGASADAVTSYGFYCDEDGVDEALAERCVSELASGDQLIVCTDIGFGSVNQLFLKAAVRYPEADVQLVTGVNLPLLLELAVHVAPLSRDELAAMVAQAAAQLALVEVPQPAAASAGDDFFA